MSNHSVRGEEVPRWEDSSGEEDYHDGGLMHDWSFAQKGVMISNAKLKTITKETPHDVSI